MADANVENLALVVGPQCRYNKKWRYVRRWWAARSSKPVRGVRNFPGGFDSHVPPPRYKQAPWLSKAWCLFSLVQGNCLSACLEAN